MLQPRDHVPHFEVADLEGRRVVYSTIWQQKNLVLVALPASTASSTEYVAGLRARIHELQGGDTEWVFTRDAVAGLPSPGIVVADRWGEVVHAVHAPAPADLPSFDEVVEWVDYVRHRCPECEGEAR